MQITNSQLRNSVNSLGNLMSQPLPISISFKLKKLKKELNSILETIEEEIKVINEKYVVMDGDKPKQVIDNNGKVLEGFIILTPEGTNEFKKLMEVTNTISVETIKISDLPATINLSTADLEILEWLITE